MSSRRRFSSLSFSSSSSSTSQQQQQQSKSDQNQYKNYLPPNQQQPQQRLSRLRSNSSPSQQQQQVSNRRLSFLGFKRSDSISSSLSSSTSSSSSSQISSSPQLQQNKYSHSKNSQSLGSVQLSSQYSPLDRNSIPPVSRSASTHLSHHSVRRRPVSMMSVISSSQQTTISTTTNSSTPDSASDVMDMFDFPKNTPTEMMPILTLLHAQKQRTYFEGYFMILNDLNSDGKLASERKWVEVLGRLTGTVLAIWDVDSLERAASQDTDPTPTYINITDSTFKSIASLPSPSGDLSNIIVLSTTLKNRFLLQFANSHLLGDWTAAFRLALFEYTSLQEAYTGALLSAKGAKLNGIRTLLHETKYHHEDWVSVRFGAGMPWKKCWTVVTPPNIKKKKNMPPPGTIAFYEDKKKIKRPPLAVISGAYSTYAVYPQNSVLVDGSTLIKVEGKVAFNDVEGEKDAAVFLMPEAHPGVPGYETLIRFLIPVLDVFQLYGRPKRLNADKADMRSLLFAMPSLPYTQYLEFKDVQSIVTNNDTSNWTAFEWTRNIKEYLAKKLSSGYKGCGRLTRSNTTPSNSHVPPRVAATAANGVNRSVSSPINSTFQNSSLKSQEPTLPQVKPEQPKPHQQNYQVNNNNQNNNNRPGVPPHNNSNNNLTPARYAPPPPTGINNNNKPSYPINQQQQQQQQNLKIPPPPNGYQLSPQNSSGSYRSNNINGSSSSINSNNGPMTPNFSRPPYPYNNTGSGNNSRNNSSNYLPNRTAVNNSDDNLASSPYLAQSNNSSGSFYNTNNSSNNVVGGGNNSTNNSRANIRENLFGNNNNNEYLGAPKTPQMQEFSRSSGNSPATATTPSSRYNPYTASDSIADDGPLHVPSALDASTNNMSPKSVSSTNNNTSRQPIPSMYNSNMFDPARINAQAAATAPSSANPVPPPHNNSSTAGGRSYQQEQYQQYSQSPYNNNNNQYY